MARTPVTENGWPSVWRDACETIHVPGTRNVKIELLSGDVAVVLAGFMAWIHRNVRSIEPADGLPRNWWGHDNSVNNACADSNHYSGTCFDICANELPWQKRTMPQDQIDKIEQGIAIWQGLLYWGGWWKRVDEMHVQLAGNTYRNPRLHEFAERLRNGYLGIFKDPDPNEFPLPDGYYYGPLDGPFQSISGQHASDSQAAKDGLGRWQLVLGLKDTKIWNDGVTPKAAFTLQKINKWPPNPLFGFGGVYLGEWNEVIRNGKRLPKGWRAEDVTIPGFEYPLTKWGDYSQYQKAHLTDAYPYQVICFRASVADSIDDKWTANMKLARAMVGSGRLKKIIAYHFWVPGYDNWGTFQKAIELAGGAFPELCFMLDLERAPGKWDVRGDQSVGVLDFIRRGQDFFANPDAASLYVNFTADPDLMPVDRIPPGLKIIVPRWRGPDDPPVVPAGVKTVFGHQYASNEDTPPFGPSDINQSHVPLSAWLEAWGTNGGPPPPSGPGSLDEYDPSTQPTTFTEHDRALLEEVRDLLKLYMATTNQKPPARRQARSAPPPRKSAARKVDEAPTKQAGKRSPRPAKTIGKTAGGDRSKDKGRK